MPRAKRLASGSESAALEPTAETRALVETLHAVASQIQADPTIATRLMAGAARQTEHETPAQAAPRKAREIVAPPLDPFATLRQSSEQELQKALASLDLTSLKAIVRAYRLDPARISARWTAPERIAELIVEQVTARLNHGRAFERV
jgi:hypothetical protein